MNFVFYLHDEQNQIAFEQKLLWFKRRYNLIGQDDVRDIIYNGKKMINACHLTVDDGWRSTYDVIFPIMQKHKIPFSIFVSPEIVSTEQNFWYYTMKRCNEQELKFMLVEKGYYHNDAQKYPFELLAKELQIKDVYALLEEYIKKHGIKEDRGFVNKEELLEMDSSGLVEIGAHTMTHPILAMETTMDSRVEIGQSVYGLSRMLGKEIKSFAYPNGLYGVDFTQRDIAFVKECGIDLAFSVNPGVVSSNVNPMVVPRIGSEKRLWIGRLGCLLPSITNQVGIRKEIRRLLKK